jgi:hypothetical protein
MPKEEVEESILYGFNDIDSYTDETTEFVKQELTRLLSLDNESHRVQ